MTENEMTSGTRTTSDEHFEVVRRKYEALTGRSLSDAEVIALYSRAADTRPRHGPSWGKVATGVTIATVAALISFSSMNAASSGGGHYVIFWGAVVWGGWMALKGLAGE